MAKMLDEKTTRGFYQTKHNNNNTRAHYKDIKQVSIRLTRVDDTWKLHKSARTPFELIWFTYLGDAKHGRDTVDSKDHITNFKRDHADKERSCLSDSIDQGEESIAIKIVDRVDEATGELDD
jgi:hypothetical protein